MVRCGYTPGDGAELNGAWHDPGEAPMKAIGPVAVSGIFFLLVGCSEKHTGNSLSTMLEDGVVSAPAGSSVTTLWVDGRRVQIIRDQFGIPHIFARTNRGLFVASGYAIAQDRLWQLETYRRAGRGTLAEILGDSYVPSDQFARLLGYRDSELDEQFSELTDEEQEIFNAYVEGINRYITEVVLPDPDNKLPVEFIALQMGIPRLYDAHDLLGFLVIVTRQFGEIGGRELTNQAFLLDLIDRFGQTEGYGIFNDARWLNDLDSPASVPSTDAPRAATPVGVPRQLSRQLAATSDGSFEELRERALALWQSIGIPTKLGSYAWAVDANKSANGNPMLYGGPQMGFNAPEIIHEIELQGGNGFHVDGLAIAGGPGVIIGHNQDLAWSLTTGAAGDNLDIYVETLCANGMTYLYQGDCLQFDSRIETINVRGRPPIDFPVLRTVHGPVIGTQGMAAFSQKRAHWMAEIETVRAFSEFGRAHNLDEFLQRVDGINFSFNVMYADREGNIGYFYAGLNPVRPDGYDLRLPFPGDGSAEWTGQFRPNPRAINPARGWFANWNNKPSVDYASGDAQSFGKIFRANDIFARFADGQISREDMRDIPRDVARVKGSTGRESRFLLPYLLAGLDAVPPSHRLAGVARAQLESWDGSAFEDAISSTNLLAGEVIFSRWLNEMVSDTFADVLGTRFSEASSNMLLHALDFAFTGSSGVPPSRDYFNGQDPNALMSAAFDQIIDELERQQGEDPSAWTGPRGAITFAHPLLGTIATIPASNRSTYGQIVELSSEIDGENIFTLGQSGFARFVPPGSYELDPHFMDLLPIYRQFQYKPMGLLP